VFNLPSNSLPTGEGELEERADRALREGLERLPVPEASPEFDARVLAAVRQPVPWWQALRAPLRPMLSGAACSLVVTLALIYWSSRLPATVRPANAAPTGSIAALDQSLDRPDLSVFSHTRLSALRPPWQSVPPQPRDKEKPGRQDKKHGGTGTQERGDIQTPQRVNI
jgi:hypothetical protein